MRQRLALAAVLAAAVAVVVLLPLAISDYRQLQAAGVATFFVAIVGLNILTGYTGQISLGHGAFMAIGGYTTAILTHDHGWNLFATIPVATAIAFVAGVLVGLPATRLSGAYLALATFAVALVVPALIRKFDHFTGGNTGILIPFHSGRWLYVVSWITAGACFEIPCAQTGSIWTKTAPTTTPQSEPRPPTAAPISRRIESSRPNSSGCA